MTERMGDEPFDPLAGMDADYRRQLREAGERTLPTAEFNALLREECERVGRLVPTLKGGLAPMIVLVLGERDGEGGRGRGLVAIGSFPEGEAKRRALFHAGLETAKHGKAVLAATLVFEA